MLTIRQSLLSLLFFSLQHTNAQKTSEDSIKTICTPATNQEDPHLAYLQFIERSGDFCTKLTDAKFADTATGYRDPVMSIAYTRSPTQGSECTSQKRDGCLKNLRGLADICKLTQTFEYPTDQTTYLQGSSSHPTSCGTYKITIAPVVKVGNLGANLTAPGTSTAGKAKDPNLTDNSGENGYGEGRADDGSGYLRSVASGRVGGGGVWAMVMVGLVVGFGGSVW